VRGKKAKKLGERGVYRVRIGEYRLIYCKLGNDAKPMVKQRRVEGYS